MARVKGDGKKNLLSVAERQLLVDKARAKARAESDRALAAPAQAEVVWSGTKIVPAMFTGDRKRTRDDIDYEIPESSPIVQLNTERAKKNRSKRGLAHVAPATQLPEQSVSESEDAPPPRKKQKKNKKRGKKRDKSHKKDTLVESKVITDEVAPLPMKKTKKSKKRNNAHKDITPEESGLVIPDESKEIIPGESGPKTRSSGIILPDETEMASSEESAAMTSGESGESDSEDDFIPSMNVRSHSEHELDHPWGVEGGFRELLRGQTRAAFEHATTVNTVMQAIGHAFDDAKRRLGALDPVVQEEFDKMVRVMCASIKTKLRYNIHDGLIDFATFSLKPAKRVVESRPVPFAKQDLWSDSDDTSSEASRSDSDEEAPTNKDNARDAASDGESGSDGPDDADESETESVIEAPELSHHASGSGNGSGPDDESDADDESEPRNNQGSHDASRSDDESDSDDEMDHESKYQNDQGSHDAPSSDHESDSEDETAGESKGQHDQGSHDASASGEESSSDEDSESDHDMADTRASKPRSVGGFEVATDTEESNSDEDEEMVDAQEELAVTPESSGTNIDAKQNTKPTSSSGTKKTVTFRLDVPETSAKAPKPSVQAKAAKMLSPQKLAKDKSPAAAWTPKHSETPIPVPSYAGYVTQPATKPVAQPSTATVKGATGKTVGTSSTVSKSAQTSKAPSKAPAATKTSTPASANVVKPERKINPLYPKYEMAKHYATKTVHEDSEQEEQHNARIAEQIARFKQKQTAQWKQEQAAKFKEERTAEKKSTDVYDFPPDSPRPTTRKAIPSPGRTVISKDLIPDEGSDIEMEDGYAKPIDKLPVQKPRQQVNVPRPPKAGVTKAKQILTNTSTGSHRFMNPIITVSGTSQRRYFPPRQDDYSRVTDEDIKKAQAKEVADHLAKYNGPDPKLLREKKLRAEQAEQAKRAQASDKAAYEATKTFNAGFHPKKSAHKEPEQAGDEDSEVDAVLKATFRRPAGHQDVLGNLDQTQRNTELNKRL